MHDPSAPLPNALETPPAPAPPSRGRAVLQIAIVIAVMALWQVLLKGSGLLALVKERLPNDWVYLVIFGNGLFGLLGLALVLRLHGESWASVGLRRTPALPAIGIGLGATVLCYVANIMAFVPWLLTVHVDATRLANQKMEGLDMLTRVPLALILPIAVFAGLYEEILFRGFLLSRLTTSLDGPSLGRKAAVAGAVLLSALGFGLPHAYQGAIGVVQTFSVGLVLALLALWRGNIWSCIVAHAAIDTFGLIALHFIVPMANRILSQPHG